jgi:chemotaxis protein CheC
MGDLGGHILLSLTEDDARRLVDLLYGMETGKTKEINEEALSALNEITNIIGSSIINVISEKTKLQALPSVPKIVKDFFSLIADGLIIGHGGEVDFAILMDTEFFISESALMGNLYLLPKKRSIIKMLERLRGNG